MNPSPHPPTAPHFLGLYLAVALLIGLVFLSGRQDVTRRLGISRGPLLLLSLFPLAVLALFGSGDYGMYTRMSIGTGLVMDLGSESAMAGVTAAMPVVTSDEFVRYGEAWMARRQGATPPPAVDPAKLREEIRIERSPLVIQGNMGQGVRQVDRSSVPAIVYYSSQNYGMHLFRRSTAVDARASYVNIVIDRAIEDVARIALFRAATTDEARIEALQGLCDRVPMFAEWTHRDLSRLLNAQPAPSDRVRSVIETTAQCVRQYIADPSMRALTSAVPLAS